jgi:hypothetical protein
MTVKTALDRLYTLQQQAEHELGAVRQANTRSRDYVSGGAYGEVQQYILGRLMGINAAIDIVQQVKGAKDD